MGRFADIKEPRPRCSLGKYLDDLPEEDADELRSILNRRTDDGYIFGTRAIRRFIVEAGDSPIDRTTIAEHRRGTCKCRATS